jgi:hypothetical protein
MQAATLFVFAALGLVMLLALGADMSVARIAVTGLAVVAAIVVSLYLAQRAGGSAFCNSCSPI